MTQNIVPLFGTGNEGRSKFVSDQRRINLYAEAQKDPDKGQVPLYQRPGLKPFTASIDNSAGYSLIPGPVRGAITVSYVQNATPDDMNPGLIPSLVQQGVFAAGNSLYAFDPGLATLKAVGTGDITQPLLTLKTSSGAMQLADNGLQVMAVDGTAGYIANYSEAYVGGGVITDPDFPALPSSVTFIAERFVVNAPAFPGRFYWSDLQDGTSWDPLNFATAESNPDPLTCVFESGGSLILFGTRTTEFWAPSTGTAAFARVGGSGIDWGTTARDSIRKFQGGVVLLARNLGGARQVIIINGYTPQVISTPDVERSINSDPNADGAVATVTTIDGHPFYVLNLTDTSWVFNSQTGEWDEWQSDGRWTGQYIVPWFNTTQYVTDVRSLGLYTLDSDFQYDGVTPIAREVVTRHLYKDYERVSINKLTIDAQVGKASVIETAYPFAVNLVDTSAYGATPFGALTIGSSNTTEFWVQALDNADTQIVSQVNAGIDLLWYIGFSGGDLVYEIEDSGPWDVSAAFSTLQWSHVAATFDFTTKRQCLYVNGVLADSQTAFTNLGVSTGPFSMGAVNENVQLYDVRVWNYARTAEQIAANMYTQFGTGVPGLIGLWNAFKNDGTLRYDNLGSDGSYLQFSSGTHFVPALNQKYITGTRAPQLMLQVSRDNGNTWGSELWQSLGYVGEYYTRTAWRRLGRGRDFLFKLRMTDPVPTVLTGGAVSVQ